MDACTTIAASRESVYPPVASRKAPGETDWVENDISSDVDCDGQGVTILSSVWIIHADDDDATLTLGAATWLALVTRQPYSGGTDGASYRLINTVTTNDGRTFEFTVQVSIAETVKAVA